MKDPVIIGVMRIKNEERWIGACLREATKICARILVLDDGSTDNTPEICRTYPKVRYRYYRRPVNEGRDRQELLQWALEHRPDWVLILDGDEVLEDGAAETIRREISRLDPRDPVYSYFMMHILYFWNDPDFYRCEDSIYGNFWIPRLFTTWGQEPEKLFIGYTGHGHNLHASGVPVNLKGKGRKIDVRVKHYGYLDGARRRAKYEFYRQHDPETAATGYYEHLTSEAGMSLAKWTARSRQQTNSGLFIKPMSYYRTFRPEVAELVPAGAAKILDVGCGQGLLGLQLKEQHRQRTVVGVERDPMAAAAAAGKLDEVLVGDIENMDLNFPVGYFDCIIVSNVLEYLYNPWDTILYLKKFLDPQGCMILRTFNVKNITLINQLINNGRWKYQEIGMIERGYLRFYTVHDLQEMLVSSHMTPDYIIGLPDPVIPELKPNIEMGKVVLKNLSPVEINELRTAQILIRAKPCMPLEKPAGLVSIVIPSCNQLELTRLCLESIKHYTAGEYEIIVVDNGSDKDTVDFLAAQKHIRLIQNNRNLGFAAACNQGMAAARGKYICLLNNDTIVTRDWLTHLVHHLEKDTAALAVGPVSNHAPDEQQVQVDLNDIDQIQAYAQHIRITNWQKSSKTKFLSGFCLLLKSEALKIIGGFDTRFWPGNFEDDDYCLRIKLAGYEMYIARDVYIHHFGGQTFAGQNFNYDETMTGNWQLFREKWGLPKDFNPNLRRTIPAEQFKGRYAKEDLYLPLSCN